jgi:hypothetical protein
MVKKYFALTVSNEYLLKIGRIIAYHSAADQFFRFTIQILMDTNQNINNIILYRKQTESLLNMIEELLKTKYQDDNLVNEYKEWKSEFKNKCQNKRNEYAHSVWCKNDDQTEIIRIIRKNKEYKINEIAISKLSEVIGAYSDLLYQYNSILKKISEKENSRFVSFD